MINGHGTTPHAVRSKVGTESSNKAGAPELSGLGGKEARPSSKGRAGEGSHAPVEAEAMKQDRIRIVLPWPDSRLMPNRRNGKAWQSTHAQKVRARQDGYLAAIQARGAGFDTQSDTLPMSITFVAKDRRKRDLDGLYGSLKHYQDGIAQALGVDDSRFRPVTLDYALDAEKKGFVIVEIGK